MRFVSDAAAMTRLLLALALSASMGCSGYDPCDDKECGDACRLCDPDDADCIETGEFKVCNSELICTNAVPALCGSR